MSPIRLRLATLVSVSLLAAALSVGCDKKETTPSGGGGPGGPPGGPKAGGPPAATGEAVFQNNCAKCHTPGKGKAPDLSKIAADPAHTKEWLIEFVKKPGSKKEGAKMPAFEGKLSDAEFNMLGDYLSTMK